MKIESIQRRKGTEKNKKINKAYNDMQSLIEALDKKDIPADELISINEHIVLINSFDGTEKELVKSLKKTYGYVLTFIEKNLKLVPKHHFLALWMLYGSLLGVVLTSIFISSDGLASLILPMGMAAGIVIGSGMDNNAKKEGLQIELEVKKY